MHDIPNSAIVMALGLLFIICTLLVDPMGDAEEQSGRRSSRGSLSWPTGESGAEKSREASAPPGTKPNSTPRDETGGKNHCSWQRFSHEGHGRAPEGDGRGAA